MNNTRRKAITKLMVQIEELRSDLECLLDEEQEAFDNMPEGLQYSERGERMEEIISYIEDAVGSLEEVNENLEEAIS